MTQLLVFKELLQKFYQKYALALNLLSRFAAGYITFYAANHVIGYSPLLNQAWAEVVSGFISMVFPVQALLFLAAVFIVLQIAYVSAYLAFTTALIFTVLYFIYIRFLPKHGFVILAMPVLYTLNIPYMMPVVMGLVSVPVSIIPVSFGIIVYYFIQDTAYVISTSTEDSINLYKLVLQQLAADTQMYVSIMIFAIVIITVYFIRNMKKDYSFQVAVFAGSLLNLILFIGVNYLMDINVDIMQFLTGIALSCLAAWIIQFFRFPLNYSGAENLQFEDDEYYYYVRAVPKMNVTAASKKVKRFNSHNSRGGDVMETGGQEEDIQAGSILKQDMDITARHDFEFTVSLDKDDLDEIEKIEKNE
ncbi:MAG: hypothetical protein OSJ45_06430 [Lachnospiraceae bacterium]|nr:hypothetical protein [Lachnospiraceae bacterium]